MAQHFDSRSRFLSIATMSLRASVKLVQIRAASRGPKDGMQRSEIRLLPRSIYLMSGPARANCHLKDEPNVQAQGNHKGCPCCWTHGIDTDQTEAQGRIGVTFRQLAPWALHEAELKRLADERAERDKAAEEGALQPRRRSTPATKRDAPTGPATWLSGEGADAVRAWRSTLAPDAWDALAAADGLTLNNVPARGWHREVKAAGAPLPPAPKPRVASTASDWVAACTDLLELAGKEKGGLTGLRGELGSRGFRCGEPKREGVKEFDVSMPQEFPCYYDIVGKSYSGGRQDLMSSRPGLMAYLEGCIALARKRKVVERRRLEARRHVRGQVLRDLGVGPQSFVADELARRVEVDVALVAGTDNLAQFQFAVPAARRHVVARQAVVGRERVPRVRRQRRAPRAHGLRATEG